MMDEAFKLVLSQAVGTSFPVILLIAAVSWLNNQNRKTELAREKERGERWADIRDRIGALEGAMKACEEDRRDLRDRLFYLASGTQPPHPPHH